MAALKMLGLVIALLIGAGAQAETWRHPQSNIALEIPSTLRLGEVRDIRRDGSDVIVQLGDQTTIVTFFVYRAAYPSVGLWYHRAVSLLRFNFGLQDMPNSPRQFAVAGSTPNGLRQEFDLPRPAARAPALSNARATAVAMTGRDEWLVKVRITSIALDRAAVSRLMDEILAGVRMPAGGRQTSLALPPPCPDTLRFAGRSLAAPAGIPAGETAQVEQAARGRVGLAVDTAGWCRAPTGLPPHVSDVYARLDGSAWVALILDNGAAITAVPRAGSVAAIYGSTPAASALLSVYDGTPPPDATIARHGEAALAVGSNPV